LQKRWFKEDGTDPKLLGTFTLHREKQTEREKFVGRGRKMVTTLGEIAIKSRNWSKKCGKFMIDAFKINIARC
jgi:hypothetical protein